MDQQNVNEKEDVRFEHASKSTRMSNGIAIEHNHLICGIHGFYSWILANGCSP